jgi:hypothetical protein
VEDLLARATTHAFTRDCRIVGVVGLSTNWGDVAAAATAAKLDGELFSPPARKATIAAQDILTVN